VEAVDCWSVMEAVGVFSVDAVVVVVVVVVGGVSGSGRGGGGETLLRG
jgi:hypothetical protein